MKKFLSIWALGTMILSTTVSSAAEKFYDTAPSVLPQTDRNMKTAGFWISRHPLPDQVILDEKEILDFNKHIREELKLTKIVTGPATISGLELKASLEKTLDDFIKKKYFWPDGARASAGSFESIRKNMDIGSIPEIVVGKSAVIVHYVDQRILPTENGLYAVKNDIDFDELQNSALNIGTPVKVLLESLDGFWVYVQAPDSDGWVKKEFVAECDANQFESYAASENFIVALKAKAEVFLDENLTEYYDYVQMGVRLPYLVKNDHRVAVMIPVRDNDGNVLFKQAFMERDDVSDGYLSFTPRNIFNQAFELLNAPYGWGGMYGEQDCSRFLQEIFSTAGIELPRNSSEQGKVGRLLVEFTGDSKKEDLVDALKQAPGGISFLKLKGHIMLFLGFANGRPYAIHETWGYREPAFWKDRVRVVNRVIVSDLSLGEGSKKGSLLERLQRVVMISK